ncbi:LuxR C-terminal-related transcriptional regulator, partial [Gordonia polyisoprenivorans]
ADHTDALLAAYRGDADAVDVAVYRMSLWDNPSGIFIRGRAAQARAVLALGAGAGQRAHRLFGQVAADGNHTALIDSDARMVLDVAQAAVAASATADVAALIERLTGDDKGMPLRRLEPLLRAGALAVLTCRRSDFEQALAVPDADRRPFDLARIRLSYGVMLRSRGDRAAARHELRSAASIFRGLRARPWLAQAEEELRRLGDAPGARATLTDLTPIGLRVAELAASGLSNRQIGELLHLSPSTVGTHLSSVYATLGVTSRAALRDSLGRDAGPGG